MYVMYRTIDAAKAHLEAVAVESTCYCDACKASRQKLKAIFTNSDGVLEPPLPIITYNTCKS